MKKTLSKIFVILLGAMLLVACGEGSGTNGEKDKFVVYGIYKSGDQSWFIDEGEAARKVIEAAGGEFIYVDAKMNSEEYLKAIDNAIANNAAGILTCIHDQTMSQSIVDKVTEAGIPIIAADDPLQDIDGEKIAPWVGINSYKIGESNGEWIANYVIDNNMVEDPEVGLLIITMDTVSSVVPRTDGQYDKFTEVAKDFDTSRIFKADYDGTVEKGNIATMGIVTGNPQIKKWIITGGNEEGTIGALRALETAGLDKDSVVVGMGGYLAKDEWNQKSADETAMKAATYYSADAIGTTSAELLLELIDGKEIVQETAVDAIIVTPENYKEVMGAAAE